MTAKVRMVSVVLCPVGRPAVLVRIENRIEVIKKACDATTLQQVRFEDIWLWCDDDGMLRDTPLNRGVPCLGYIHGPFFFAGQTGAGNLGSIGPKRAVELIARANKWPMALTRPLCPFPWTTPNGKTIIDERCHCGAWRSIHEDTLAFGHGACPVTHCTKFTLESYVEVTTRGRKAVKP